MFTMRIIRLRFTRVLAASLIGSICLLLLIRSAVDVPSTTISSESGLSGGNYKTLEDKAMRTKSLTTNHNYNNELLNHGPREHAPPAFKDVDDNNFNKNDKNVDDGSDWRAKERKNKFDDVKLDRDRVDTVDGGRLVGGDGNKYNNPQIPKPTKEDEMERLKNMGVNVGGNVDKDSDGGLSQQRRNKFGNVVVNNRKGRLPGDNNLKADEKNDILGDFGGVGAAYPFIKRGKFIPLHRIVHFDLKGAPPKSTTFFDQVFRLIASLGATGVLLEWEDMFPYTGKLALTRNGNAYSFAQIKEILEMAKANKLDIIPLVQTFGHLEWILKLKEFAHLREVDRYPQVICLSNPEAVSMVKDMIDQVMLSHRDYIEFFHMGADEAFHVGLCEKCQKTMQEMGGSRDRLMLRHIVDIANYIRNKYSKKVLMWHDMLNNLDTETMKDYRLGELVEPMVWAYAESLNEYLTPDMWQRFSTVFPYIWGASAFKGADGPSRYYSNIPHYLNNHMSWIEQMTNNHGLFKQFRGIVITGWQRFDHFAVLCEILPVGIPSLAINLATIRAGHYSRTVQQATSKTLQCSNTIDIDTHGVGAFCKFPGAKLYQYVQQLRIALEAINSAQLLDDYQLHGWIAPFNTVHNYSSAYYLDQIADKIMMYLGELQSLRQNLKLELSTIFFNDCVDEWLFEYVDPHLNKLIALLDSSRRIAQVRYFPRRPFNIKTEFIGQPPGSGSLQQQQQQQPPLLPNNSNNNLLQVNAKPAANVIN